MGNELNNEKVWEIYKQIRRFENEVVKKIVSYFEKIAHREAERNEI
jgi:hypothetical protein